MARTLIDSAARSHARTSRRGMLESLFAHLFSSFVYPQIWEDPLVDMEALRLGADSRLIAISSGGCNVMSYLSRRPRRLVAVDLNPAHLALLRLKLAAARHLPDHASFYRLFGEARDAGNVALFERELAGVLDEDSLAFWRGRDLLGRRRIGYFASGLYREGLLGRSIGIGHLLCRLHGFDPARLAEAPTLEAQRAIFERELAPLFDRALVRLAMRLPASLFGLGIPPAQFEALRAEDPDNPAAVIRGRVERLLCAHPIRENYFAHQALTRRYAQGGSLPPYLAKDAFAALKAGAAGVETRHASLTSVLAAEPRAAFNGFVLLDAQDWMTTAQLAALWTEIDRCAAPGARVIFRTAGAASPLPAQLPAGLLAGWRYAAGESLAGHRRDRSGIYGGFHIYERQGEQLA